MLVSFGNVFSVSIIDNKYKKYPQCRVRQYEYCLGIARVSRTDAPY